MAQHKAPTEVTVVPTVEVQGFALWVQRYWKPAAALAVLVAVSVLTLQFLEQKRQADEKKSWATLSSAIQGASFGGILGDPDALRAVSTELDGTLAGPWAQYSLALSLQDERRYEEAVQALEQLRKQYPDSLPVKARYAFGEDSTPRSPVEQLIRVVEDQAKWMAEHPGLFSNPEPPADAPKVKIRTDEGSILVALYPDRAPEHVGNFLALCSENFYAGTKFHRVMRGFMIQGGDPNSRESDPSTWGTGTNGGSIPSEKSGLYHFEGFLAGAKPNATGDSSDCQFYITTNDAHHLDENYTVFGKVLEGLDVAKKIEEGEIEDPAKGRPKAPVTIQGTDVL